MASQQIVNLSLIKCSMSIRSFSPLHLKSQQFVHVENVPKEECYASSSNEGAPVS